MAWSVPDVSHKHTDHTLVSALRYTKHKTGLGYRLWSELIRDFPKVRDAHSGDGLKEYDVPVQYYGRMRGLVEYMVKISRDGCPMPQTYQLLTSYVMLQFPIIPHKHTMEIQLTPYIVERLTIAVNVGAVTINDKTISVAYEPQPITPVQPKV